MLVAGTQQFFGFEVEFLFQFDAAEFHVVDVGACFVEASGGGDGNHIILAGSAEHAIDKVNRLFRSCRHADAFGA